MSELRSVFSSKDFIVNSNIVKCISQLDISLDEFLLILYFINVSLALDTNDIKLKLGFSDDKIFNTFNTLVNKKMLEMIVINDNNKVIEQVSLDPFYDRLALNKKIENNEEDIYVLFENELGRTLSSFEYELINKWLEKGIDEHTIKRALKEAILNGVTSFKYIDKIVYEWSKNGIKKKQLEEEKSIEELFDYDWLEDNE
ncbi:MAG: DnaD domain protein [Tenericutes bacterium]|nr:DnaD domain protein [Mycoplasmatota bacterium]